MDFTDQLRVLEAAQGDLAKLALATVDLTFPALAETERGVLRESLEAAAIPHWCDESILSALLEISLEESAGRLDRLRRLAVVEPFPARGRHAVNVHESARLALRESLARRPDDWFRLLCKRASDHFREDQTPAGRIEWIYHLLCADPDLGATEIEELEREWSNQASPEVRIALATALTELETTGLVKGRARAWVLLVVAWIRTDRGEDAQLGNVALEALELARSVQDSRAEAEAQALLGRAFMVRGKLAEARTAYKESLAISRRLAELDPSNAGWQQDLGVAHSRVGDVLEAQGRLGEAQAAFEEDLAISRRLAELDPSNAGWQRGLGVAHSRVGGVLEAQGRLGEAQAAFEESLAISRRLAELDPSNAGWQQDLGVAHSRVGGVLEAQGRLGEAQAAFEESLAIIRRLAELDPSNAGWQRDLGVAHSRVRGVLEPQGWREKLRTAIETALGIRRQVAKEQPGTRGS